MKIKARVREIFECEGNAIKNIKVSDEYENVIKIVGNCKNKVITTGIGKAGIIARKFAATLSSTGTASVFLHPCEARHGDLGVVEKGDIVFVLSNSGKSSEVLKIISPMKQLGVKKVIGITSHVDSELYKYCDNVINMGSIKEACSLELTPTTSIAVMLAIVDAIALVVMERKNFTREMYGARHHGGYLGKLANGN